MTFDLNDAQPQMTGDLIPGGTFAKVVMHIRNGGVDGTSEVDRGLLKPSNQPGSDVLSLDAEFTVLEGPHARRKFWQTFTVMGGKLDEEGQSIGWKISKSTFRAMIDSALGLRPDDMSEESKDKRVLRGLSDLNGISFVGKIAVEPNRNSSYKDSNKLDHVVLPTAPEWQRVMNGEHVPSVPSSKPRAAAKPQTEPAWSHGNAPALAAAKPAWVNAVKASATLEPSMAPAPTAAPTPATAPVAKSGPAWLKG